MATLTETQERSRAALSRGQEQSQWSNRAGAFNAEKVAKGLGWFSIGLGLTELIAPRAIAKIVGSRNKNQTGLIRAYGVREIAAGVGVLSMTQRSPWLWARVAGDILDLTSLGRVARSKRSNKSLAMVGIASVAGVTALDIASAAQLARRERSLIFARAEGNMIVDRSPEECYQFWRNLENLPRFMYYLDTVRPTGDRTSHWIAKGPVGTSIEWDSEIVSDVANRRLAWRSQEGSDVWHTGAVDFERAPGGRGTIVRVQIDYGHPFRGLEGIGTLLGKDPEQLIRKELRRFKQVLETGEVITTEGQSSGRASGQTWLDKVAL